MLQNLPQNLPECIKKWILNQNWAKTGPVIPLKVKNYPDLFHTSIERAK